MSGDYTYYCDGFFGFGPPGTFRAYSLMHFAPIVLCIGLLILVWFRRDKLRKWEGETHLRFVMAFLMFVMEFGFFVWLLYVGDTSGNNSMMTKLPLHVCDLGLIICMFMVPSKNKTLFGINFFVTLFGATLACIIPQTVLDCADPSYFRYYQYFGEHLIPIFGTVYMIIVHRMRPRYRDIWVSTGVLAAMLIPAFWLNEAFPGSDYMFLRLDTTLFPENQYVRAVAYTVLIIVIFHLMWFIWNAFTRGIERKSQAGQIR